MKYWKEYYGATIDGDKGENVIFYEFEDTKEEREEIVEALYQRFIEQGLEVESADVEVYCNLIDENIEVSVEVENYIDDLIEKAKADKANEDDIELIEYIQRLSFDRPQNKLCF